MAWGATQDPYGGANDGRADTRQKNALKKGLGPLKHQLSTEKNPVIWGIFHKPSQGPVLTRI